jgi:hypothetical protein
LGLEAAVATSGGTIFKYASLPDAGGKGIKVNDQLVVLFNTGWERGRVISLKKKGSAQQKKDAMKMLAPVLIKYLSVAFYYLHDLGADDVPYLTKNEFENLSTNTTEEEDEGIETPGA